MEMIWGSWVAWITLAELHVVSRLVLGLAFCLLDLPNLPASVGNTFNVNFSIDFWFFVINSIIVKLVQTRKQEGLHKFTPINASLHRVPCAVETYFHPASGDWWPNVMQHHALTVKYELLMSTALSPWQEQPVSSMGATVPGETFPCLVRYYLALTLAHNHYSLQRTSMEE